MTRMFKIRDTKYTEAHQDWIGRKVVDRYGQTVGRVADLLIEERTLDEAMMLDRSPFAWTVRARYAVIRVGNALSARFGKRKVVIPIASLEQDGELLRTNEDGGQIRVTLAA